MILNFHLSIYCCNKLPEDPINMNGLLPVKMVCIKMVPLHFSSLLSFFNKYLPLLHSSINSLNPVHVNTSFLQLFMHKHPLSDTGWWGKSVLHLYKKKKTQWFSWSVKSKCYKEIAFPGMNCGELITERTRESCLLLSTTNKKKRKPDHRYMIENFEICLWWKSFSNAFPDIYTHYLTVSSVFWFCYPTEIRK